MAEGLGKRVRDGRGAAAQGGTVASITPGAELIKSIRDMEPQYKIAMGQIRGTTADQLVRDAVTLVRNNPDLLKCDQASVLGGLMSFAQLGLRVGTPLGHGWLIPMWSNKHKAMLATVIIGYKGYSRLGYDADAIMDIAAHTIRMADEWSVEYGTRSEIIHRPAYNPEMGGRGEPVGYYCVVNLRTGGRVFHFRTHEEMCDHRDQFAMAREYEWIQTNGRWRRGDVKRHSDGRPVIIGPWRDHFEPMAWKGLAVDTPIPTPSGWTTMGLLGAGDVVLDMHGQPTGVRGVTGVKHLDCYRVTFGNGASIVCDAEHRWLARIGGERGVWPVYEIAELHAAKAAGKSITMPITQPLQLRDADLPLDPWVLGYWLGDGSRSQPMVTCNVDNRDEIIAAITSAGYQVGRVHRDPRSRAVEVYVKGIKKMLADLGVLGAKHVPAAYLRGSVRQRLALLRGLMDSDGSIGARGRAVFDNTNPVLTDAVAELARSLGEVTHRIQVRKHGFGRDVTVYRVSWQPAIVPVALAAKVARICQRKLAAYRTVTSVERIPTVPTCCIAVDSLTATFLAGRDMVPTHNTEFLGCARWIPMAPRLELALAGDGTARLDLNPKDTDGVATGERPEDVVDGEVVDEPRETINVTGGGRAPEPDGEGADEAPAATDPTPEEGAEPVSGAEHPEDPPTSAASDRQPLIRRFMLIMRKCGTSGDEACLVVAAALAGVTPVPGSLSLLTDEQITAMVTRLQDWSREGEEVLQERVLALLPGDDDPVWEQVAAARRAHEDAKRPSARRKKSAEKEETGD